MSLTPNKSLSAQSAGSNSGVWGEGAPTALNEGVIIPIDNMLGGVFAASLSSSPVVMSSTDAQNVIVSLSGVLLTNIQVTNPCIGFYFVENLCTGNFNVTVTNGVSGVVVPKGYSTLIADATNGVRIASTATFPTGTSMTFQQTSAPTGWTKSTTHNDKALRIVSGTASSGGTVGFTTAFASQSVTGSVGGTALTQSQLPSHFHLCATTSASGSPISSGDSIARQGNIGSDTRYQFGGSAADPTLGVSSSVGNGNTHTHSFSGNAINIDVQYVDLILAVKN